MHSRGSRSLGPFFLAFVLACGGGNGSTEDDAGVGDAGIDGGHGDAGDGETDAGFDGAVADAGSDGGVGSDGAVVDGAVADADTTADAGLCPPEPGDTACDDCAKASCCDQLAACRADVECVCVAACVEMGGGAVDCHADCGLSEPSSSFGMWVTCVQANCTPECS